MLLRLAAVITLTLCVAAHASSCAPTAITDTATYHGTYKNHVEAFLGVQYAQDTSGKNRFKPPIPFVPSGLLDATSPGPACPQLLGTNSLPLYLGNITGRSTTTTTPRSHLLSIGPYRPSQKLMLPYTLTDCHWATATSEDCLRLNVFRPNGTTAGDNLPIMVYIHGGTEK